VNSRPQLRAAATAATPAPASHTSIAPKHKSHVVLHRSTYGKWSPEFIKISQLAVKEENVKRNNRGKVDYVLKTVVDARKSKSGNTFKLTLQLDLSGKLSTYEVTASKDGKGGVMVTKFEDSDEGWLLGE
jgi:hypothetical protein